MVTVAAGEAWDDLVARRRRAAAGSASRRCPGIPGLGRRHPDPERRRLRPGGQPDHRLGAGLGPQAPRRPHLRQRRLRLRLPARRGSRPTPAGTSCSSVTFQLAPGRPRRPGRVRRARPRPRRRAGRAGAAGRRPRGGARRCAAARAWCSTPPTTTPGARARSSPTRSSRPTPCPRARRRGRSPTGPVKTSAAWLIEHAGFGKGYGGAGGGRCPASTPSRSPTAAARTTADLLALAREVRDGVEARFGIRLVNEPVLVGCEL